MGKGKNKKSKKTPKPKQRIALISTHGYVAADPPLGAPDTGGQVVYVLELAKKLAEFGYHVDVWTRQFEDQPEEEQVNTKVRILRAPCGGKDFIPKEYLHTEIPSWTKKALAFIKKHNLSYDFINSHYWDAGLAGEYMKNELQIPHLHTPHSIGIWKKEFMEEDFNGTPEEMEEKYNFSTRIKNEIHIYKSCEMVIATTPIQYDRIATDYGISEDNIKMIPPGYDDNRFFPVGEPTRQTIRERFGFDGPTVFGVSRLALNKGVDLLMHGFGVLASRLDNVHMILAIGHEDRDEGEEALFQELLELRKQYGVEDRVTFIGYITDEDLPDYYRAADVFVLPSRYEPFGMTAVEAMACGTPTVVTIHGGLYRILNYGINTLFADPFDKEDLGITLLKAFRYKSMRQRLATQGSSLARSKFTWTGIAQQLLNAVEISQTGTSHFRLKPRDEL